jgi:hypothetical protein
LNEATPVGFIQNQCRSTFSFFVGELVARAISSGREVLGDLNLLCNGAHSFASHAQQQAKRKFSRLRADSKKPMPSLHKSLLPMDLFDEKSSVVFLSMSRHSTSFESTFFGNAWRKVHPVSSSKYQNVR